MEISLRILLEVSHQVVPSVVAGDILAERSHENAKLQQEDVQHDPVIVYGLLHVLFNPLSRVKTKNQFLTGACQR